MSPLPTTTVFKLEHTFLARMGDNRKEVRGLEAFKYIAGAEEVEFMGRFAKECSGCVDES